MSEYSSLAKGPSHRRLKPLARLLAPTAAVLALAASGHAQTVQCYPAWNSTTAYTSGAQVSQNNENYVANYSSTGSSPSTNSGQVGSGDPWIPAFPCNIAAVTPPANSTIGPSNTLMGYWENWGTIPIYQMNPQYKVLFYCFAEGSGTDGATLFMWTPSSTNPLANAASDIAQAKANGVTVLLSIGGATSPNITLQNSTDVANFVSSCESLVTQYGFQGIDLDLENTSLYTNAGDSLNNPQTPNEANMISAIRQIKNHFGSNFLISMVPQTAYTDAITSWGGYWGSFLPLLSVDRDIVNICTVQDYNSGNMVGADGNTYGEATADFEVAMAELLIKGFTIDGGQSFLGIAPHQQSIGVEVNVDSTSTTSQAWEYLAHGVSYGGSYHLLGGPYPTAGGVTIWDANQDAANGYAFASMAAADGMNGGGTTGSTTGGSCTSTPSAPTGLAASGTTSSGTTLSWSAVSAPANCSITGYTVYKGGTSIGTTSGTSFTVTGLSASTSYSFTVAATDSDGTGSQSSAVNVTTSAAASCTSTPSAPTGLAASNTTSTGTTLNWTAVTAPANCSITGYTIYKGGTSIGTSTSTSYTVTGLTASTAYTFTVAATDSDGTGSQSSSISVTTSASSGTTCWAAWVSTTAYSGGAQVSYNGENYQAAFWSQGSTPSSNSGPSGSGEPWIPEGSCGTSASCSAVPSAPTGLAASGTTSTGTTLNWSAVTAPANCSITSYTIYKGGTSIGTSTTTSFAVTGLTAGTAYTFTVAATDSDGTGSQSSSISVTTTSASCSATPSAPTGLAASSTTSTGTTLKWTAPTPPANCSITSYTIYKGGTSIGTSTTTSFNVTGLSASTTYTFTVAATDSDGTGSQSSSISVTTTSASCSATPSAPTGLAASNTTSTGTTLSWTAVTAPANCSITSYTIYKGGTSIGTSTTTSFAVTGLTASTTYSFTVAATDSDGTGSQSSALSVTTSAASGCTGIAAWSGNSVSYAVGALVTYNGKEYKCIQAHTSEAGWDPVDAPSLWSLVGSC